MQKIYSKAYLKSILEKKQLKILGEIKTSNDKVLCETQDRYLVLASPMGIIRRNDNPSVFSKYNPHTIHNIKLWLKNNYIESIELLSQEYIGSKNKLLWLCKNCGCKFTSSWNDILLGKRYCNYCAKSKRYDNLKDYTLEISKECEKRGYVLITKNIYRSTDKFEYICKKHSNKGTQISYYDRFINSGQGCKYCGIESRGILHRMDEEKIRRLVEDKGLIYCGVNYDNEGKKEKKTNIQIICPKHQSKGIQTMKYYNLLQSSGNCIYCRGYGRTKDDIQSELDLMKSNVLILEYTSYSEPIKAKCTICGHEWTTSGVNLTQGHSCPNCCKSKFELEVQDILEKYNFEYKSQYWFHDCRDILPLPFDFYLINKNILIEADGEGHYKPIKRSSSMSEEDAIKQLELIKCHDRIKTDYCKENQINLIRIPYWERNNLETYLIDNINKAV